MFLKTTESWHKGYNYVQSGRFLKVLFAGYGTKKTRQDTNYKI